MIHRRQARELALQVLFQSEFSPKVTSNQFLELFDEVIDKETLHMTDSLVQGVQSHKEKIDQILQSSSNHWKIDRMSTVDRNILRIATFEMHFASEPVKPSITINEAIEISKKYGTSESSSFVNGLLDQVAKYRT
ncbi:MAG: transcription antitermination factor NusB [Pseudobdellovibrionaceae bacterium]